MDRTGQLKNVSFGGAWSEQIAGNEALAEAMAHLESAVAKSRETDLRHDDETDRALAILTAAHPKGGLLSEAWQKALKMSDQGLRAAELARIAAGIKAGLGKRLHH